MLFQVLHLFVHLLSYIKRYPANGTVLASIHCPDTGNSSNIPYNHNKYAGKVLASPTIIIQSSPDAGNSSNIPYNHYTK